MHALLSKIKEDLLIARKSRISDKVSLLTTFIGDLQRQEHNEDLIDDVIVIKMVRKYLKNMNETLAMVKEVNAVSVVENEINILLEYLPRQLNKDQIEEIISANNLVDIKTAIPFFKNNHLDCYDNNIVASCFKSKNA